MPVIQYFNEMKTCNGRVEYKDTINLRMCRIPYYPNYYKREHGNSYNYIYADEFAETDPKPPYDEF